jgi:hypothetical protein
MKPTSKTNPDSTGRPLEGAKMKSCSLRGVLIAAAAVLLVGCATYPTKVEPTPILRAQEEIAEDQLIDVGILPFESPDITAEKAEAEGTHIDIRKAESNFIPCHLRNTLQQSSQWGAVRVIPAETNSVDVFVKGQILASNGEHLTLQVEVVDAAGKNWFKKKYKAAADQNSYSGNEPGEKDPFQDLYNRIANDMAKFKQKLAPVEISKIRTVSKLKFARDFAPDAFGEYLTQDKKHGIVANRLPAGDDPMMQRLLKIREREYMFVDTLNQYYDGFYNQMWPTYENWRNLNLTERLAMQKIKREALTRQLIGALLIAGAVAAGSMDSSNTGAIQAGMIIIGGQVIISGFNVSKEAEIHKAAIQELGESFGSEMQPVVMELEGKQYELTGTAGEQFAQWRELLRKIYLTETGFEPESPSEKKPDDNTADPQ